MTKTEEANVKNRQTPLSDFEESLWVTFLTVRGNQKFTHLSPGPARYLAPGIRTGSSSLSSVSCRAESLAAVSSRGAGPTAPAGGWGSGLAVPGAAARSVPVWPEVPASLSFPDKEDSSGTSQGLSRLKSFRSPGLESDGSDVNLSDGAVRESSSDRRGCGRRYHSRCLRSSRTLPNGGGGESQTRLSLRRRCHGWRLLTSHRKRLRAEKRTAHLCPRGSERCLLRTHLPDSPSHRLTTLQGLLGNKPNDHEVWIVKEK